MPERLVLIGTGGHAREVLAILRDDPGDEDPEPIGFVAEETAGGSLDGLPVLGDLRWLRGADPAQLLVICAVGTPALSRRLVGLADGLGLRFARAVSRRAWVVPSARVGVGVMLFPNSVVSSDVQIGDHVTLNVGATVSHDARVGAFCSVGPGAHLAGNVTMGEACFVGMGANVIQGVTVGEGAVIGAAALVLDDVPPRTTVFGVPARVVGPASEHPMARNRSEEAIG